MSRARAAFSLVTYLATVGLGCGSAAGPTTTSPTTVAIGASPANATDSQKGEPASAPSATENAPDAELVDITGITLAPPGELRVTIDRDGTLTASGEPVATDDAFSAVASAYVEAAETPSATLYAHNEAPYARVVEVIGRLREAGVEQFQLKPMDAMPAPPAGTKARPVTTDWKCPFPAEADPLGIDEAAVLVIVTVGADAKVTSTKVLEDPGHGFAREAARCAEAQSYKAGTDADGHPVESDTPPIRVRFTR